ncbi:MAG: hypothetical protein ACRDG8_01990 [Actinomycetota bacterium]
MRRRLIWGLTALVTVLAVPAPARSGSDTSPSPRTRVAGINRSVDPGGSRPAWVPRLVREGSDLRSSAGGSGGASPERVGGPLVPTVLGAPFDGLPDDEEVSPGDPIGALGIDYHLAAVNVRMAFYDRMSVRFGPKRLLENLDDQLPPPALVRSFDPKVAYDPYRQHFLLVFLSSTSTQSFISVVVIPEGSEGTTGDWCTVHMSGDQVGGNGKQFADYPMIGFTEDRVTITTNQFDFSRAPQIRGFQYAQVISMRKTPLYDCGMPVVPIKVFGGSSTRDPDGSRAFTIVPTISVGGSPTIQYMTSLDFNGSTGKLILWRLRVVNGALALSRAHIAGEPMFFPRWGRQCGQNAGLDSRWDTGDLRLTSSFWDADRGRLYTATAIDGNIAGGGRESVIRWWEVDPSTALANSQVTRKGRVAEPARDLAWPSVATDGDGKLWVTYARAGFGECLAAYASLIQLGTTASTPVHIRTGSGRYEFTTATVRDPGIERWGDYTAITRDPVNQTQMAAYGAHPTSDGGGSRTHLWQQVIATLTDT